MIGVRMKQLRDQLKRLARQRDTQRRSRSRSDTLSVSLVGYTNAGKSTLFNRLTRTKSWPGHILMTGAFSRKGGVMHGTVDFCVSFRAFSQY